jgi:hypothetical protein
MIKVALCFIISGSQILHKEKIWQEWIETNKDIINIYFYYSNYIEIKSDWIKKKCIPKEYVIKTSYYHIIPCYIGLMKYAITHDNQNKWFCFLTDTCCPILNPYDFRKLFFENYLKTIMTYSKSHWNVHIHKRANLKYLPFEFHLKNTPYFILSLKDVLRCLDFTIKKKRIYDMICKGGIANESLFAIILKSYNQLNIVENETSTIMDWSRMTTTTSPYLFKEDIKENTTFINEELKKNKFAVFIRKIHQDFPDEIIKNILKQNKENYYFLRFICFCYWGWYFFLHNILYIYKYIFLFICFIWKHLRK